MNWIPGSEVFNSRPIAAAELAQRIDPKLELHTVGQEAIDELDPLTYEVIRHRLWSITDEMGETLKRMSGSIVVTEANDFDFAITDEMGEEVQIGLYNTFLAASLDLAIYWTLQHRSGNPGIEEGDMFLTNDPWVGGGLHQNDATVFQPIFFEGRLFNWSSAVAHMLDVGGVAPGSWTPRAQDVFWESLPTPPVKIVRDNVLQQDVADLWLRRSRTPTLLGLDLRAKIGANVTCRNRILRLLERYGPDTVKAVMKASMNDAEERLRAKLRALPDGTWRAVGYQEHSGAGDRGVYKIALAMTKADDRLTFDLTGTDPQSGMINCPYSGIRAGIMSMLLPILAGDIPWAAGGLMRCIDIISEEGTINNATFPAAIGKGPVGPAWTTGNLVAECMAKMLEAEPEHRHTVQSVCAGTFDMCALAGLDQRQNPFVSLLMDPMAGGFGAHNDRDGVDTAGQFVIPMGRAPDAEMTELTSPVMLLWRREEIDSGGPGRQRGGVSGSVCFVLHDAPAPLQAVFSGTGKATSMNVGLAGGYPGSTQLDLAFRGSIVGDLIAGGGIPTGVDQLGGEREVLQCEEETVVNPGDAVFVHWQSGGGYGDPLLRAPESVVADVREMKVSPAAATQIYGVVLDVDGEADPAATEARRRELRAARGKGAAASAEKVSGEDSIRLAVNDNLQIASKGGREVFACAQCDTMLCERSENPLEHLSLHEGGPGEAGPHIWADPQTYLDVPVVFRQYSCPSCGVAMLTQVVPESHPLLADTFEV